MLLPYLVQNKYVPHKTSRSPQGAGPTVWEPPVYTKSVQRRRVCVICYLTKVKISASQHPYLTRDGPCLHGLRASHCQYTGTYIQFINCWNEYLTTSNWVLLEHANTGCSKSHATHGLLVIYVSWTPNFKETVASTIPGIKPPDSFLWGHLKDTVYSNNPHTHTARASGQHSAHCGQDINWHIAKCVR
jgi:hypothetical protein